MLPLVLPALIATAPVHAAGQHGPTVSFAGGWLWTDRAEAIDSSWVVVPRVGYTVHRSWTFELDLGISEGNSRLALNQSWRGLTPRANLLVDLSPDTGIQPFFVAGAGTFRKAMLPVGSDDASRAEVDYDFLLNVGYGTFFRLVGPMMLRVDFRSLINLGEDVGAVQMDTFVDWELSGGLVFRGSELKRDRDFDQVPDRYDGCPDEAEDIDGYGDADGCPEPDNDEDGVLDGEDRCPVRAEDRDGFQDQDGCPELDNDGDRIPDTEDDCPDQAEDTDGWRDADGCPDKDNDEDGINDEIDQCPLDAEDPDHFKDSDGCPDPDNDGDGLADYRDACPDTAETFNDWQDGDGCPDEVPPKPPPVVKKAPEPAPPPEIQRFSGVIEGIQFESGSATITLDSYKVLAEAADVLVAYPLVRIEIEGHTDSDGPSRTNLELSAARARAVVQFLIQRGADPRQLEYVGYGETRPLVPNDSPTGKAANRRVEFKILDDGTGGR